VTKMFRLLGQRSVSAVRRRGLLLSSGTTSRLIRCTQVPCMPAPRVTVRSLARRFSSDVDPPRPITSASGRQQQAKESGRFVDIHDITVALDPKDFLITDVDHVKLRHEIAQIVGIYVSRTTCQRPRKRPVNSSTPASALSTGRKARTMFSAVVMDRARPTWSSPLAYLSAQAGNPAVERSA